ncbi:MAG: hypothetical protein GY850_15895 [bacterium]|nr:hypothetical protein [bacterium]
MYLLELYYANARLGQTGKFIFPCRKGTIPKWTILSFRPKDREKLQLMALAMAGTRYLPQIPYQQNHLLNLPNQPCQIEFYLAQHSEIDGRNIKSDLIGHGLQFHADGRIQKMIKRECRYLSPIMEIQKIQDHSNLAKHFMLAYGPDPKPHRDSDDFDFNNPFLRITRFYSLFDGKALLTDPVVFLERLHKKAFRYGRVPPRNLMAILQRLLAKYLQVEVAGWNQKTCDMRFEWLRLSQWQRRMMIPILDACRHLLDAFPLSPDPLKKPGLVLLDRPHRFCTAKRFPDWIQLFDELLPHMQFVVTLTERAFAQFPEKLRKKRLEIHGSEKPQPSKRKSVRIRPGTILLIDVDGRLPNFALMKLSRYFKEQGRKVILGYKDCRLKGPEAVNASAIFHNHVTDKRISSLRRYYGDSLMLGGSGVDINRRLPENIEKLPPDYDLYPEFGDRAIGFLTRGCPFRCAFCIVPAKEGRPRQVSDLDTLLAGKRKLILLDDNILSHPKADDLLEQMISRNIQVNFTQTLDFRMLNSRKAALLRQIKCSNLRFTRSVYHFSLNNNKRFKQIARKYEMLRFTPRDNVEFICMYGFDTTLAEDVARFRFLRSLPGAYVFMQQYQPILGGPPKVSTPFFDENADDLIDELVGIVFTQNMKSMEKYYRWVSKRYAETFRRLHKNLVNTIFKYNVRGRKGKYIATLAGTRKWST